MKAHRSPVATRIIAARTPEMEHVEVAVEIFAPIKDGPWWRCDYTIIFPEQKIYKRFAGGVDSLQAIMLAVEGLQAEVLSCGVKNELKYDWDGVKFKMSARMKKIWGLPPR